MSDTIDFGIDLGTTNSAIAVVEEDGSTTVIKNNDGWDTTPSAVWIPEPGTVEVGRPARERMESDPDNCAAEFKLEMGRADAGRTFANAGVSLSPSELSAEVLKSLRNDVAHVYGTEPDAAVITVPAAFTLNQNNATKNAAMLAGLGTACPLVQEPTAAAVAYGFDDSVQQGYWMVFDFGGGTFDAAIVSKQEGDLRVLNHAGDPYLGGKLIDWVIVERLLAPEVSRQLGLGDFRRDNPAWRVNFGKLKQAAEKAKIRLSRSESALVMAELNDGDGRQRTFRHTISRGEVDALAEPQYVRAINLCHNALAEGGLTPADIDRLVLVGGVTLMPGLRERLADPKHGLGVELDYSVDPTTVVARGAAILAGTLRRPPKPHDPAAGAFSVTFTHAPVVTVTRPAIAGELRSTEPVDWTAYSLVFDNPRAQPPYRSPRVTPNAKGAFITDVDIDPNAVSRFGIELLDSTGSRQKIAPDTLMITHRPVDVPSVTLTHSLGIQQADRAFAPLLRKGATLPARVREVFRTSGALHRTDTDVVIRIPVVQGESSRGDRNRQVGMLEIRPQDVRIDLPAGTEVEVTFEVDMSSLVTVVADVPLVQTQFEAEIDLDNVGTPSAQVLEERLQEAESRLGRLHADVDARGSEAARRPLSQMDMETLREQVNAAAVDVGAAGVAEERLRNLQADMDDIEEVLVLPELIDQLRSMLDELDTLLQRTSSPTARQEAADLRRRAESAIDAEDPAAIRKLIDRAGALIIDLERRGQDWPVKLFYYLRQERAAMRSASSADALIREGEKAIAAGDLAALGGVNERLFRLLPPDARENPVIGVQKS
ncbi:Hsp70 family protein [Nonomuraea typhae]|uniref:Hsp70 family protein n=1 Tax=Nonomuraea typhae TaxID=2603600 RepID=A0ABW7YSN2_9ACTN